MLTIYPSNKLEILCELLIAVLERQSEHRNIFEADTIIVENEGIQHWLNLNLARQNKIAMNINFQRTSRFIWDLSQQLLHKDKHFQVSPFQREVMSWCFDELMASDEFIQLDFSQEAVDYWGGRTNHPDELKRYQLASRLADVFEQYILYRSDWFVDESQYLQEQIPWQAWLWKQLLERFSHYDSPIDIQKKTLTALDGSRSLLPEHIYLFGINTLPPQTIHFFSKLSEYTHVHFFHLNPCVEFWGDIKSDKAKAMQLHQQNRHKQFNNWLDDSSPSNPLLANLGVQGRELFNLLLKQNKLEIEAFSSPIESSSIKGDDEGEDEEHGHFRGSETRLLHQVQSDILELRDQSDYEQSDYEQSDEEKLAIESNDNSISIHSCHGALREIQVLHDFLLSCFDQNPSLRPGDVLVMCPTIEDYAPYINSVFRHINDSDFDPEKPRLACSITDRSLKDAEPIVAHFLDLSALPDSRFEVSKILDYLRLSALQRKFGFDDDDLDTIQWWLKEANIHWGLDQKHKSEKLDLKEESDLYTWSWGLNRLIKGFAYSDSEIIQNEQLLLPHIDGQSTVLLGRLMQLLEELQQYIKQLAKPKTAVQWQSFLHQTLEIFYQFNRDDEGLRIMVKQVINSFYDNTALAQHQQKISYAVMRYYLQQSFIETGAGHQFLNGQITFCSMVPMRSIPFQIIAVLGLNDGQFPRQSTPVSFDLMSREPRREGDRSRRADDRYLFLEALISAREKLYLSYQGKDIRQNTEKQPSLILKELMVYLESAYGWQFDESNNHPKGQFYQHGLHPFSHNNYLGEDKSYDASWLRFCQVNEQQYNTTSKLDMQNNLPLRHQKKGLRRQEGIEGDLSFESIELEELVKFFDNPLRVFAQQRLDLFLDDREEQIDDSEPFDVNGLVNYQLRYDYCEQLRMNEAADSVAQRYQFAGILPDSPLAEEQLNESQMEAQSMVDAVNEFGDITSEKLNLDIDEIQLMTSVNWLHNQSGLISWRPAKFKPKDIVRLWLNHLVATIVNERKDLISTYLCFKDKGGIRKIQLNPIGVSEAQIALSMFIKAWKDGLQSPAIVHAALGEELFKKNAGKTLDDLYTDLNALSKKWQTILIGTDFKPGLMADIYFSWFYSQVPDLQEHLGGLYDLYQPLYFRYEDS